MTRVRRGLARAATIIAAIFFWTWLATKIVVTLIGATTVVDDYNQFIERLPEILAWLFSTPWWVPSGLATILTGFLIWLSWPMPRVSRADPGQAPAPSALTVPAQRPEALPSKLIARLTNSEREIIIDTLGKIHDILRETGRDQSSKPNILQRWASETMRQLGQTFGPNASQADTPEVIMRRRLDLLGQETLSISKDISDTEVKIGNIFNQLPSVLKNDLSPLLELTNRDPEFANMLAEHVQLIRAILKVEGDLRSMMDFIGARSEKLAAGVGNYYGKMGGAASQIEAEIRKIRESP
jgi:hypothetical protein